MVRFHGLFDGKIMVWKTSFLDFVWERFIFSQKLGVRYLIGNI